MADDGGFVIAWEGSDGNRKGILAQRYDASGLAIGGEFRVNTARAGDQAKPSIAMGTDGAFVVAWEGVDADRKGVFARRFTASGAAIGGEFRVNAATSGDQDEPTAAIAGDGSFVIA
jgi:hypothetical protein